VSAETVLVTGASGFIGSRLAARLVGEGRRVRCLVRASSDTARLSALGVELVRGDLADVASLGDAVEGAGCVFHCAAMVSDWGTVREIARVNVAGTRGLLEAAAAASVERFVHVSTTDVYGHPGVRAVEESYRPARFANWYAQTKLEAEAEVWRVHASGALRATILRPATVYGPGSREVIGEIARAIRARQMLLVAGGRANAGLCYVENLVDAALLASEHERAGGEAINVCDGLAVSWRRFVEDLATGLGAPRPWLSLPYRPALALGLACEQGYRALRRATGVSSPALLSRQAVQVLGVDQDFSNRKARELLGWEPRVGYEDGLAATLAWLTGEYLGEG
jgi:nucleoside-diphosphate-sugar epimerase